MLLYYLAWSMAKGKFVEAALDVLGIRSLFQAIVCAEDYERGKLHSEAFLAAKLMSVPPEDCVVFENSLIGIEVAKTAGMALVNLPC